MIFSNLSMPGRIWNSPTLTTFASLFIRTSNVAIILPFALHSYNPSEIVVWQLFTSIFSIILMLDFGLSPTFSRLFSYTHGDKLADSKSIRSNNLKPQINEISSISAEKVFGSMQWIYPRLALGAVILFLLIGSIMLKHPISQCANQIQMWIAWAVVLLSAFFSILGNSYVAALHGMNHMAAQRRLEILTSLLQILASILVLSFKGSILTLVIVYQAFTTLNSVASFYLLKKKFPKLATANIECNKIVMKHLWPAAWRSGLGVISSFGTIQASGIIYAQIAPAAEAATFLFAQRLLQAISTVAQVPFYAALPKLTILYASADYDKMIKLSRVRMIFSNYLLLIGIIVLGTLTPYFVSQIKSQTNFISSEIWILMGLAITLERIGAMYLQVYSVTNNIKWHIANGISGLIIIGASISLYFLWGTLGIPVGWILGYVIFFVPYSAKLSLSTFKPKTMTADFLANALPLFMLISFFIFLACR